MFTLAIVIRYTRLYNDSIPYVASLNNDAYITTSASSTLSPYNNAPHLETVFL